MTKIIVLNEADIIDGVLREAGEVVTVPDGYTNIRRVIVKDTRKIAQANRAKFEQVKGRKEREARERPDKEPEKVKRNAR